MFSGNTRIPSSHPRPRSGRRARGPLLTGVVAALMLASASVGCATARQPTFGGDWADVSDHTWHLVEMAGQAVPPGDDRPTLTFSNDTRAVGNAGVNRYFATYQQDDFGHLTFGIVGSTRMAAPDRPAVMQRERRYLDALNLVGFYGLDADRLTLYAGDRPLLRFVRGASAAAP